MRSSIEDALSGVFQHADDTQSSEIRAQIDRLSTLVEEAWATDSTTRSMNTCFTLGYLWQGLHAGFNQRNFPGFTGGSVPAPWGTTADPPTSVVEAGSAVTPAAPAQFGSGRGAVGQDRDVHAPLAQTTTRCPPLEEGSIAFTCNCAHGRHGLGCILDIENGLGEYFAEERQDALRVSSYDQESVRLPIQFPMP